MKPWLFCSEAFSIPCALLLTLKCQRHSVDRSSHKLSNCSAFPKFGMKKNGAIVTALSRLSTLREKFIYISWQRAIGTPNFYWLVFASPIFMDSGVSDVFARIKLCIIDMTFIQLRRQGYKWRSHVIIMASWFPIWALRRELSSKNVSVESQVSTSSASVESQTPCLMSRPF